MARGSRWQPGSHGPAGSGYARPTSGNRPSAVLLLADPVLLELLVEVRARGADGVGGGGDVPLVLAELLDEERPLGRFLEVAERARGLGRAGRASRLSQHIGEG